MKSYTERERQEHIENWKKSNLAKTAYAKSAGIFPTTFYNWVKEKTRKKKQGFVEINKRLVARSGQDIVIEKGDITVRIPLPTGANELQTVFSALAGTR